MKLKRSVFLFCSVMISFSHAEVLTQTDYDQQIQHHMQIIQQTKAVLDEPNSKADANQQSQAFCDRLNAYEQIAKLSKDNANLEMASIMLMASQSFLDKQKARLGGSGMTAEVFCAGKIKQ